jgi:hypothetical protein
MAVVDGNDETVLVTSALDRCVHRYRTVDGQHVATFMLQWNDPETTASPLEPTTITTNLSGQIIVTVSDSPTIYFFDSQGKPLHVCRQLVGDLPQDKYTSGVVSSQPVKNSIADVATHSTGVLPDAVPKINFLLSAVCCDPFDNILVADFMANCIHFVSPAGQYLGRLLTKADGIACPNCISLDQDGRLYVGQYGGDMLVFQYLSCVKHA